MTEHVPLPAAGPYLLDRAQFPVTFQAFRMSDGIEVWKRVVLAPDNMAAVRIPGLAHEHGPCRVRVTFATGQVEERDP